ncbi:phytoene desaturase family protein [Paenibacillus soyae]|uniref:FAD-dependent oxidoreductase n=1 Tax=Paenibacillus soyae TaxID=2969249 RepID=A0A9X2MQG7_9BACL|nr:FAD-dependent oxidoreductase [Paenibacillus soyae]MCR2806398.1 FAD-dependent oxidoreductase [Paenibacillus soyae]
MEKAEVVIVGGGIAGLTAAVYAARAGKRTVVIEKQQRLGGRAVTNEKNGVSFNLGGHALYDSDAMATFRDMGLTLRGKKPSIDAHGIWKGKLHVLPTGPASLLTTPLIGLRGKIEFGAWLTKLGRMNPSDFDGISLREWVEGNVKDPMVRHVFYSLLRTTSYVMAPDLQTAGPVLRQFKAALQGVLYVDEGWGSIVRELEQTASKLGVRFLTKSKAVEVNHEDGAVRFVRCEDGTLIMADAVILAAPPAAAHEMVPHAEATSLRVWKEQAIEVTVACLDVALRKLPKPKQQFVYGIDQPVFLTDQSRAARLSKNGEHVVCVIKYQGADSDPADDLRELEGTLDLVQPGWRDELAAKQFLPRIAVCGDFPHVKRREQPGPAVPEIAGLYVAGDWASHGEILVDASTASAKRAVSHLLARSKGIGRTANNEHRVVI